MLFSFSDVVSVRYEGTLCLSIQNNILSALKSEGGRDSVRFLFAR